MYIYVRVAFNYKYPFIIILSALIAGIIIDMELTGALYCYFCSLLLACTAMSLPLPSLWKEIVLLGSILSCGLVISAPTPSPTDPTACYDIRARCDEILPHHNYLLSIGNQRYYLSHFYTDSAIYAIGDSLYFPAQILPLKENANPGEFNHARYLKPKNVTHRLIPLATPHPQGHSDNLYTYFEKIREKLVKKTQQLFPDTSCHQLINALCLGYKQKLNSQLQNLFTSTGTIHLLSVSGLHTGAIYLLILFIFKNIGLSVRKTKLWVLPALWGYACLTGLSPSVVRASILLSFISVGQYFKQSYTPLNSVAAAAFITLLIRPSNLYSLSFLLSYSAYTGILTLYPYLYRYSAHLPAFWKKIYACGCITIAAQIPTLPLSAYYFHTININGLFANLLAVPLATILLYSSTICLFLPTIISQYLAFIPATIAKLLTGFLHFYQPFSLNIDRLYPPFFTILLGYAILLFLCLYFSRPHKRWIYSIHLTLGIWLIWNLVFHFHLHSRQEIIVFHFYRQSTILLNYRSYYMSLYQTSDMSDKIQPYLIQSRLRPLPANHGLLSSACNYYANQWYSPSDTITIVSPDCLPPIKGSTLIVTQNLSPEQVFQSSQQQYPPQIILDGSNSPKQIRRWEKFCREHNISIVNTFESGSIRIPLP